MQNYKNYNPVVVLKKKSQQDIALKKKLKLQVAKGGKMNLQLTIVVAEILTVWP